MLDDDDNDNDEEEDARNVSGLCRRLVKALVGGGHTAIEVVVVAAERLTRVCCCGAQE